ncbi:hypothetical protein NDU88_002966 [Pleurodeles waltl]|uniref:Uncharacterized protein n=1 Tax=Pleurodeles waltl TaxID=8319 RepID=A0AAV7SG10_PLEWA|nr:hypothetical protein NDU88_002966 [Pleurodeles waltl]
MSAEINVETDAEAEANVSPLAMMLDMPALTATIVTNSVGEAYTSEPDELEGPEKGTCETGTSVVGLAATSQSSSREESTVWGCYGYDHPTHTRKDTTEECFTEPESPSNELVKEGGSQPVHCPEEERADSPPSQGHFTDILGDTSWEKHPDCSGGDSHARVIDNNPESESQKPSGRGSDAAGQESSRELTITVLQTTVNLIGSLSSLHDRLGEVSEPANTGFRDAFEDEGCPGVPKQKPTARSSACDGQFQVTDPEGTSLKKPENGINDAESIGDSIETTLECLALVREDCTTAPKILHSSAKEGQENEEVPENTFSFKNVVQEMATDVGHKEWILPEEGTLGDKELTKESNGIDCQCQIQEFDPEEVATHEPWILQVHAAQEEQENIESNTNHEHAEGDRLTEEIEIEKKEENHQQARRTVGEDVTCLFSRSGCEELCYPGQTKNGKEQIEESTGSRSDEEQRTFTVEDATQHETTQTTGREQKIEDFMAVCKEPNASEKTQEEEKRMIEVSTQMLSRTGEQERNQRVVSGMSLDEPEWNPTFSVVSESNSGQCEQWEEERRLIENATDTGPAWHHILAQIREAEQATIKIEHGGDNPPAMSKDATQEIVREDSTANGCKGHEIPVQPKETLMEVMIKDTSKTGCEKHGPQAQRSNGKQGAENTTIVKCEGHNLPERTEREVIKAMAEYIKMGECREWDQKSNVQQELCKSISGTKWEEHDPPAPAMSVEITVSKSKGLELPEEVHDEVMENSTPGEQDTPAEVEREIAKSITMAGAEIEENEDVSRPRSEGWDSSSSVTKSTVKHTLSTSYKGHDSCIEENNFIYESQYPVAVEAINYTTRDDYGKLDPLPQNGMAEAEQTARNDSEVNCDLKNDKIELTEDTTRTEGERHDEIQPAQEWEEVTQDATRVKFERIESKEAVVVIENKSMDEGEVKNSSGEDWVAMTDYTLKATLSASHEAQDFQIEGNYDLGRISCIPRCEVQDLLVQKGAEVIDCSSRAECKGQDTVGQDEMQLANVATGAEWETKYTSVQDALKASEGSRRAEHERQDEELPVDEQEYAAQAKSSAKYNWQNPLVQERLEVNADATWVEHEGHIPPAWQEMKMNNDIINAELDGQSPLEQKEVEINKDMVRAKCYRQDPPTQEGMHVNEYSTSPEHEGHVPPLLGEEEMVQDTNSGECQAHNLSAQDKVQVIESSPRGKGDTWEVSETVEMTLKGKLCARGHKWYPCVEENECLTRDSSTPRFGSQEPLSQEGVLVMEHIRKTECERQDSLAKEENDKTQNNTRGKFEGHVPSLQQMEELPLDTTRLDLTLDTARGECEGWDPSVQESIEMTAGTTRAKCEKNKSSVQNMPEVTGDATSAEHRVKGCPAQEQDVVVEDTPRAACEEWDSPVEERVVVAENTTMAKCEGQSNVTEGHKEIMMATTLKEYAECVEHKQIKDNTDDTGWGKCEGHYPPSKGNKRLNGDISSTEWDITYDLADVETMADVDITRARCKDYKLPVQREIETTLDSGIVCEQRAPPVQEWEAINEDTNRAEGLYGPEDQGEQITVKGTYRAKCYGQHDLGKGNDDLVGNLNKPECDEQGPLPEEGVDILEDANKSQHEETHLSFQHGVAMAEDTRKDTSEGWDSVIQRRVQSDRDMIKAEFELQHPLAQAGVHITGGSSWNTCQVQQLQEFLSGEQEDGHEDIPKNGSVWQDSPAIQLETVTPNSTATELGGLHPSTYLQNKKVTQEIIRAGNEGCVSNAEGEKELLEKTPGVGCQEGQNPAVLELTDNTPVGRYGESNLPAELDHTEEGTTRCRHEYQTKPKKDKQEEERLELTTEGAIEQPYGTDQEVTGQKRLNNSFSYLGTYENTIQISLVGAHETIKTGRNELNPPVDGTGEEMPRKHSEARSDEWDPSVYRIKDEKYINGNISESKFDDQDSSSQKVVVEEETKTQFDLQELSGDRAEVLEEVSTNVTIVRCVKEHSSIQKTEAKYVGSEEAIWVYSGDRHSLKNLQIYKQVAKETNEATVVMCDEQDPPPQRKMYGFAEETCEATCTQQNQSAQRTRTEWDDTEPQPQELMGKQDVTELTAEVSKSGQERIYQHSRGVTVEEQFVEKSMRSKYKNVDFQVYGVREEEETAETIESGQEDINQSLPRMKGEEKVSHKSVNEDICLLSKEVMREESKTMYSTEMAIEDMARPLQRGPEMDEVIREIPSGIRASIHHQGLDPSSQGMTNDEEEKVEATSVGHEENMPPTNEDEKEAPGMHFTEIVVDINSYEKKTQTHKEDQSSEKKLKDDDIKKIVMDKRKLKNETVIVGGKRNVEYGNDVQGMVQTFVNCGVMTQEVDNTCNINAEYKIAPFVELDKEEDQNKQGIIKEEIFMENEETMMEEIGFAREENIVEDGVRYMKITETDNKKVSVNQVWKEVDIRDVKEVLIKEEAEDSEKGYLPKKEEGTGVQGYIREEVREANSGNQMMDPVVVESENGKDQDYRKVTIEKDICRAQSKKDEIGEEMAEKYQKELENKPEEGTLSTDDGNKYRDYAERSQEVDRVSAEMMKKKLDWRNEKMITDKREEEQKTLSENELSIPISAYYTLPRVGDLQAQEKEKQGDSGSFTPTKLESNVALNNHPKLLMRSFAARQMGAVDISQRSCVEKMKCDPVDSWTIGRLVRNECSLHCPLQREKAFIRLSKKEQEEAMRKLSELQMRLESKHQWDKERQMLRFQERLSIAKNRKSDDDVLGAHLGDGHRHLTESLQQQDQENQKTVVRQRIEKVKRERTYIMQSKRERNTSSFKGLLEPKVASGEHPQEERTTAAKAASM